ncbi:hypothetical protein CAPTEDRAFT_179663 [Capitella teleta]|uniref:Decaprenyl-diphosphate synthase subunit 1 n=1 Tax=Capitella teleta TaxID=283909 RepID=R7UXQ9_CAPTE|nr:hypothetical protein CAPTEDRAFT_179663 [Capitella teleta]|eukprot:ELU11109.1 hypothetical protein CAPTEDRAFT_179663 [Capitella teleta]
MPTAVSDVAQHHFDGEGKLFRPLIVMLMARACNLNNAISDTGLSADQRCVAMISEMIHTASLVHDDVIDASDTRRGKASAHHLWGQRKAIVAGDFILSVSSCLLAQIRNNEVVKVLSQVLEDLVTGEFMQLGSKEDDTERFNHYIKKTFKKTASLIANSCKAVSILAEGSDDVNDIAYQYGRNVGIAFQVFLFHYQSIIFNNITNHNKYYNQGGFINVCSQNSRR